MIITALLVAGCSNKAPSSADMYLPAVDREKTFDRNQDRLSNLASWQFDGRFSVRHNKGANSANLTWLQEGDHYLLKISGPLEQGTVFIRGDKNSVSYKDSKGVTDTAKTPEALLAKHTQYELPISSLRYWILGLPDPSHAYDLNIAPSGDLRRLKQHGWDIHYEAFVTDDPYRLPGKITLKHPNLNLVISIHEWNPNVSD
jgi:outer membrane lipoprotein LolB